MIIRTVATASAAALALVALSVPVGHAQTGDRDPVADAGNGQSLGSAGSGSLGSLGGDPGGSDASGGSGGEAGGDEAGSADLAPTGDEVCLRPSLGGSVAKFYPLLGIDGVPTGVIDVVTSALDSFPNLFDVIAGEGGGAAVLAQTGSLDEGLCDTIFGGEMVLPPITVIVDDEGTPVTTVTGTVTTNDGGSSAGSSASAADATTAPTSVPPPVG